MQQHESYSWLFPFLRRLMGEKDGISLHVLATIDTFSGVDCIVLFSFALHLPRWSWLSTSLGSPSNVCTVTTFRSWLRLLKICTSCRRKLNAFKDVDCIWRNILYMTWMQCFWLFWPRLSSSQWPKPEREVCLTRTMMVQTKVVEHTGKPLP